MLEFPHKYTLNINILYISRYEFFLKNIKTLKYYSASLGEKKSNIIIVRFIITYNTVSISVKALPNFEM